MTLPLLLCDEQMITHTHTDRRLRTLHLLVLLPPPVPTVLMVAGTEADG